MLHKNIQTSRFITCTHTYLYVCVYVHTHTHTQKKLYPKFTAGVKGNPLVLSHETRMRAALVSAMYRPLLRNGEGIKSSTKVR